MKTKDIVIGFIVLVALIAAVLYYKNSKKITPSVNSPTPTYEQVESKFPGIKVPSNADRASLTSPVGGQGMGEAFRTYANGKFSITIIANLPAYEKGRFYQGFISNGTSYISLGGLGISKGGYIVDFSAAKDLSSYTKIIVSSETKLSVKPTQIVLEGSF